MSNNQNNLTVQTFLRWVMGLSFAVAIGFVLWYFREVVVYILASAGALDEYR